MIQVHNHAAGWYLTPKSRANSSIYGASQQSKMTNDDTDETERTMMFGTGSKHTGGMNGRVQGDNEVNRSSGMHGMNQEDKNMPSTGGSATDHKTTALAMMICSKVRALEAVCFTYRR